MGLRILFAGGCHVNGEAADGDSKLASVALRLLDKQGLQCEPAYLIPVRLGHPRRLAQKCGEFRPDVLVLQTGYPETANLISQFIRKKLGRSTKTHGSADALAAYGEFTFDGSWTMELSWRLRSTAKRLFNAATGHGLVDMGQLSASVDRFFARVATLGVPHVAVLSPLPCADPVAMFYRRKLTPLLKAAAGKYEYPFLDLIHLGDRSLYLNPFHLNRAGHQMFGELTANHILSAVQRSMAGQSASSR